MAARVALWLTVTQVDDLFRLAGAIHFGLTIFFVHFPPSRAFAF